ncbi:MAG TPA: hypothetical protein VNT79_18385 [Phycisphaerae bacterium]|nr:hypothetical protein [Phycisphaerae bacterium]
MYVVRYAYSDGTPICHNDDNVPEADDHFPLRMDGPATPGLHRHVSIAMRSLNGYQGGFNEDFFASWIATPTTSGAKSRLLQFDAPQDTTDAFPFNSLTFDVVAIAGSKKRLL